MRYYKAMSELSPGLYIHIPYCRVACPYCDFVKRPTEGGVPARFTNALCREISELTGPDSIATIFFGGGTPSLLEPDDLARIFAAISDRFDIAPDAEIGMEINPDDVTPERAQAWSALGVNRITLGVQSFDDTALHYLGRCHNADTARRACVTIAEAFDNWGLDLIFGARPHTTWTDTLREALSFAPKHISTYGLTFEQGTPFWRQRTEALDDDASLDLYREAMTTLADYNHYEVSNFALPGYESRHNQIYWRNEEYIGLGPGAYSFLDGVRARNAKNIPDYESSPGVKIEALQLSEDEIKIETLIQHFRTRAGLPWDRYQHRFDSDAKEDFRPQFQRLHNRGLLEFTEDSARPTQTGYELNDEIGLELVSAPSRIEPSAPPH